MRKLDLRARRPDPAAVAAISGSVAQRHTVIPVGYEGDRLVLAMADPHDVFALDEVAALTGVAIEPALSRREDIVAAIEELYHPPHPPKVAAPPNGQGAEAPPAPSRVGLVEPGQEETVDLHELLEQVLVFGASDLHLTAGRPPTVRVDGDLEPLKYADMDADVLRRLIYGMLSQKQRERFEEELELDLSYSLPGKGRFRVNVYQQKGALGAAFRLVPFEIKPLEDLGIPPQVAEFANIPRGLVVVTGPTGSGKSTTLASLIDIINRERAVHIMTVEDPIEFLHAHKKAQVNQREVGSDTHAFAKALKHVLRQDPDVILVGEMRDLETIHMAVTAAETGHLVFGTLHTQDAAQTVDRIIDVFPPHQQQQIRVQLSGALMGVMAQQLLRKSDGEGRTVATEVLVVTPAVRNLIREGKTHQLYSVMQAGGQFGMQTMDSSLAEAVKRGDVTFEAAKEKCHNVDEFARLAGSGGTQVARTTNIG